MQTPAVRASREFRAAAAVPILLSLPPRARGVYRLPRKFIQFYPAASSYETIKVPLVLRDEDRQREEGDKQRRKGGERVGELLSNFGDFGVYVSPSFTGIYPEGKESAVKPAGEIRPQF